MWHSNVKEKVVAFESLLVVCITGFSILVSNVFFYPGSAWEVGNPVMLDIGESSAVSCMTAIHGRLWCGLGCNAVIVNTTSLEVEVRMGPLQLVSHMVKKNAIQCTGPQATHWDKTNIELISFKMVVFFVCLVAVLCLLSSVAFFTT